MTIAFLFVGQIRGYTRRQTADPSTAFGRRKSALTPLTHQELGCSRLLRTTLGKDSRSVRANLSYCKYLIFSSLHPTTLSDFGIEILNATEILDPELWQEGLFPAREAPDSVESS